MKILSFDHVGIVVRSLPDAVRLYIDVLGGEFVHGADDDDRGMRTIQLMLGGRRLELLTPVTPECHLHHFLDRFGEGFHHMTLLVPDVEQAAAELTGLGYEVVDPNLTDPEWREVYIRPRSGFGTLIQLAETVHDWNRPRGTETLEDVLAGRVHWDGQRTVVR
ncbi:VOC family protein [Nakamurella alba]|nr:VOC family protein [Nakamurella alba]